MRESDIENYLAFRVRLMGGEVRKVAWVGRRGAPDRFVMLPARGRKKPRTFWVELKAPGKKATEAQAREHDRMRRYGEVVYVIDSINSVNEILLCG